MTGAMELPRQLRSQMEFGNEENLYESFSK
jgi:hypothetical protein